MAFVKLDCGILRSTLWMDRDARECFLTALLMAEPREFTAAVAQFEVREIKTTGFVAVPGWYGFVDAAGVGIVRQAGIDTEAGMSALERLGAPEADSRSSDHGGRRLIRIDGGYVVLNYMKYRDRDYTAAQRMRRYRERNVTRNCNDVTRNTGVTLRIEEEEVEAKSKSACAPVPEVLGLDSPAWIRWASYRTEIRKPIKPASVLAAQRKLAGFGSDQPAVIEQSIANGWTGIFPLKDGPNGKPKKVPEWT